MDEEAGSELRKKRRGTRVTAQIVGDLKSDLSPPDVNPVVPASDGDPVSPDDLKQGALFHRAPLPPAYWDRLSARTSVASRRAGHRLRAEAERLRRHAERLTTRVREADYSRLGSDLIATAEGISGWVSPALGPERRRCRR